MSGFDFHPLRLALKALEPTPFEQAVARWALAHGADDQLAALTAWTARAEAAGDSCLPLRGAAAGRHRSPILSEQSVQALRRQSLVSRGERVAPLVIDDQDRLYFWRNWRDEQRIGECLLQRLAAPSVTLDEARLEPALQDAFADSDGSADALQRQAVRQALRRRLLILTGGPGTGKTRTVSRLIEVAQALSSTPLCVSVAAPTGKAAQRLNAMFPQQAAAQRSAQTVHRLLGFDPGTHRFRYGRQHPLQCDLLIVDEVSMLDLGTLRALLDAVPEQACLVLMGDAEQLQSVATGSVLDDIVQALEGQTDSAVVRLQHGFRSEAALLPALQAARAGDSEQLLAIGADCAGPFQVKPCADSAALAALLDGWVRQLIDRLGEAVHDAGELAAEQLLQLWHRQQLLCALNQGPFGARHCASYIESALRLAWRRPPAEAEFAGRAIMVRSNDYARGLFNGDLGVMLPDAQGRLRAWFQPSDGQSLRSFPPGDLPVHAPACAISVHKSQGSEYARVALLLPSDSESPILSRQLIYTALTRAQRSAEIWGESPVIAAALERRSQRVGGLQQKLRAAPAPDLCEAVHPPAG